jgi:hypothetical protein
MELCHTTDGTLGRVVELILDKSKNNTTLANSGFAEEYQLGLEDLLAAHDGADETRERATRDRQREQSTNKGRGAHERARWSNEKVRPRRVMGRQQERRREGGGGGQLGGE